MLLVPDLVQEADTLLGHPLQDLSQTSTMMKRSHLSALLLPTDPESGTMASGVVMDITTP
jgi:hypothetical protein